MTIESGNIYNILRTYNKQLKFGKASDIMSSKKGSSSSIDKVSLSPEAVKLMFITDVLGEINDSKVTKEQIEAFLEGKDLSRMTNEEILALKKDIISQLSS